LNNFNLTISTENLSLASLTGRRYPKNSTVFTLDELTEISRNTVGALKMLYRIFKGTDPTGDTNCVSVKSILGAFKRFYGPVLCKASDGLVLYFGDEAIPFTTKKGSLVLPSALPETVEVKLAFDRAQLNGFDELVFKISVYNEANDTLITFCLPFRVADTDSLKGLAADTLQTMLERKPADLIAFIGEVPQGGSGNFEGPTLKLGQLDLDTYLITGYRPAKPQGRLTFILQLQGLMDAKDVPLQVYYKEAGGAINGGETEPMGTAQVWANWSLTAFFSTQPEITPENPAELIIRKIKKCPNGYSVDAAITHDSPSSTVVTEEDLNFEF
jgi:hypothetical protein